MGFGGGRSSAKHPGFFSKSFTDSVVMKTVAQKRASADSRLQFMKKFHLKLELNEKRARERYE